MTERARVLAVAGSTATVRCETTESCSSCSSLLCNPRSRTYDAVLDDAAVVPGDWVEVDVPESGALAKGLLLFGLPLLLFVVVYLVLGSSSSFGADSEVVPALGGFGGLVLGFAAAARLSRLWKDPPPRIVQVYRAPELRLVSVPGRVPE